MADEENKVEEQESNAENGEARRTPVALAARRVPTSYANAFQTRIMDGMVCLTYGVSYPEAVGGEAGLGVDMERRVVMSAESAARLAQSLIGLLRSAAPARGESGEDGPAPEKKEAEGEGQDEAETFGEG